MSCRQPGSFSRQTRSGHCGMNTRLHCPCGEHIVAEDEEELVRLTQAHLTEEHPQLVDRYTRDDILWMAT
jgi:predicted small metal-binding protein